jgi:hypothetical protein
VFDLFVNSFAFVLKSEKKKKKKKKEKKRERRTAPPPLPSLPLPPFIFVLLQAKALPHQVCLSQFLLCLFLGLLGLLD